jgi:hypothetical protein
MSLLVPPEVCLPKDRGVLPRNFPWEWGVGRWRVGEEGGERGRLRRPEVIASLRALLPSKVTLPWGRLVIRHSLFFVAVAFCLLSFAAESRGRLVRALVRDGSCHHCWERLDVG